MDSSRPPLRGASLDEMVALGQAAEREGRDEDARALYETVLYSLREPAQAPLAGSLLRWIARSHLHQGNMEVASEIADAARLVSELAGDTAGVAHAQNLGGNIERERGEIDRSAELYAAARAGAAAAGEDLLLAMVEQNEGVIAAVRGEYRTALRRYRASLTRHRALGRTAYLGHALNNLGMLYTDLRRWRLAERVFDEAFTVCGECGDLATQARIAGNRVALWLKQGRWDEAHAGCQETERLAEAAGDTGTLGEVHKYLGVVARETGEWEEATVQLALASQIAAERGDLLLGAESAREQARLHWKRHEHRKTLRALNHAHGLFSRMQARRELAEVAAELSDLESFFLNIVAHWGESIESADRYTQGHCERVAAYACALAGAAGLGEDVLLWFRMGALLHDVGKIVVPPEVLNKPAALTPDEMRLMRTHPDAGVELLEDIDFPWDIRPMVRHHHEAWDGSGYPLGLAGQDIPLPARILTVADVYDALATDRAYRPGFPHARTMEIMEGEAGRVLDPGLFEIFRSLAADGPPSVPLLRNAA